MSDVDPRSAKILATQQRATDEREARSDRNRRMLESWRAGASITEIAREHGLSLSWTGRLLRQEGAVLPDRRKGVKRTDLDVEAIKKDYESGRSMPAIANKYKCSYGTIRRLLIDNGVQIRPHGGQNAIEMSPLLNTIRGAGRSGAR